MDEQMIGQTVYGANGEELGTVKEVRGEYFKVDASMQPDYWLRADSCQTSGGRLVVMDNAERWENLDTAGDTTATYERETRAHHTGTGREQMTGESEETLRLREERLRVGKEREQAGEVQLGKRVTERTETVEVPVREERVVVERRPVNERVAGGEITETDRTIEVPVERERVRAEKEAVVTEEVGVRKDVTERTQPVEANLRKEELVVEGEGELVEGGRNLNARDETYQRERTQR